MELIKKMAVLMVIHQDVIVLIWVYFLAICWWYEITHLLSLFFKF